LTQQQTQSFTPHTGDRPLARKASEPRPQGAENPSLSTPEKPDATSPYEGPSDHDAPTATPDATPQETVDNRSENLSQPYFSEAQSTLGAFSPVSRGDHFAQPEDPEPPRAEQPRAAGDANGQGYETQEGTIRIGMEVVDGYGNVLGRITGIEQGRMRLSSNDPHDDGVAFMPISLVDGIDGERVLLAGRGDASFGVASE